MVRGRQLDYMDRLASAAARGLARRRGDPTPSPSTVMLAHIAIEVNDFAVQDWLAAGIDDLDRMIHERFAILRQTVGELTRWR